VVNGSDAIAAPLARVLRVLRVLAPLARVLRVLAPLDTVMVSRLASLEDEHCARLPSWRADLRSRSFRDPSLLLHHCLTWPHAHVAR
jgi:hypothetical protein